MTVPIQSDIFSTPLWLGREEPNGTLSV